MEVIRWIIKQSLWLTNAQLEAIKESWNAFYNNPADYKGTIVIDMVKQFVEQQYLIPLHKL